MGGDGVGDGQWGAGNQSRGQDWWLKIHFGSNFGVFGWILGVPGPTVGSDWAPWVQIEELGVTFGASRLHFGCAW